MRILIAPDKFKGSLSAREVADNIAAGLRDVLPDAKIETAPMADGGEGTAEVVSEALGGRWVTARVCDLFGREIDARYALIEARKLAVIEMSEAAGMRRLRHDEYDADLASTFGVGEMILDAAQRGVREIIVGLGGSATNDGGFGMARAFGFRFFENEGQLSGKVSDLAELTRIHPAPSPGASRPPLPEGEDGGEGRSLDSFRRLKIIAAADVKNLLLGANGATRIFGPQKGVRPDKIDMFEKALTRLADIVAQDLHVDFRNQAGAGAAGGLGFGLMSFCGAIIRPGFDVVAGAVGLELKMKDVDLVITGEGSLDRQTLQGKTPAGVAALARKLGKPVYAIAGRADKDREARELFDSIFVLGGSISEAAQLLRKKAAELAGRL